MVLRWVIAARCGSCLRLQLPLFRLGEAKLSVLWCCLSRAGLAPQSLRRSAAFSGLADLVAGGLGCSWALWLVGSLAQGCGWVCLVAGFVPLVVLGR